MADPVTASIVLGAGGAGLKGIKGILDYNSIQEQKVSSEKQMQMQLAQNQAGADINSINSLKQANMLYDKQLTAAASSGASLSSGSFANINRATFSQETNQEFINQANLNMANLNTLFGEQQQQQQLQSMQTGLVLGSVADMFSTASSLVGGSFTGSNSSGSSKSSSTSGSNPFGSNLSSKTSSALSLFNLGG